MNAQATVLEPGFHRLGWHRFGESEGAEKRDVSSGSGVAIRAELPGSFASFGSAYRQFLAVHFHEEILGRHIRNRDFDLPPVCNFPDSRRSNSRLRTPAPPDEFVEKPVDLLH